LNLDRADADGHRKRREGNKWFSLNDKVCLEWTLGLAWEKLNANAGACLVDGITTERFDKDSQNRLPTAVDCWRKAVGVVFEGEKLE
jgi:hypothetical protein